MDYCRQKKNCFWRNHLEDRNPLLHHSASRSTDPTDISGICSMLLLIPPPHTNSLQSTPIIPSPHTSSSLSFVTNNLQEKLNRSSGIYREKGTVDVSAVQMAQFLQQIVCCSRFRHLQPRVSLSFIIPDHLSSSYTKPQMHSEAVICTSFYFLYFSCSY